MHGYCDVYKWTLVRRTPLEVKCFKARNRHTVRYHRFSHGTALYMLTGKNVNAMLEWNMSVITNFHTAPLSICSLGNTLTPCKNGIYHAPMVYYRDFQ